jgi:hypothetical protein
MIFLLAMGGHSFGAFTTMLVGGATVQAGRTRSFADPCPKALRVLSGEGRSSQGFTERSWEPIALQRW